MDYWPKFDEYGLPIVDGGTSVSLLRFCPWCGGVLPESRRDQWFNELEEMGIDPDHQIEIPMRYMTDGWCRQK